MKKQIIVLSALSMLFITFSSQCSFLSSLSSALKDNAQKLMDKGKAAISAQSKVLVEKAKTQATAMLEQAKAQAVPMMEKAKADLMKKADEMVTATVTTLSQEATKFANDAKSKIVEQAKAVISKNPLGQAILDQMSAADKAKIDNLTQAEKDAIVNDAETIAGNAELAVIEDGAQTKATTVQNVIDTTQTAVKAVQASIASKTAAVRDKFKSLN